LERVSDLLEIVVAGSEVRTHGVSGHCGLRPLFEIAEFFFPPHLDQNVDDSVLVGRPKRLGPRHDDPAAARYDFTFVGSHLSLSNDFVAPWTITCPAPESFFNSAFKNPNQRWARKPQLPRPPS
jgi:hypothetical protein